MGGLDKTMKNRNKDLHKLVRTFEGKKDTETLSDLVNELFKRVRQQERKEKKKTGK